MPKKTEGGDSGQRKPLSGAAKRSGSENTTKNEREVKNNQGRFLHVRVKDRA